MKIQKNPNLLKAEIFSLHFQVKKALDSEVFLSLKVEFKKIIDELGERFNFNELDDIIEPEGSTKIDLENDVQVPEEGKGYGDQVHGDPYCL